MERDRDERLLSDLWERHAGHVQAYALRHVDPPEAQEVVADTFLVAWRRLPDVPEDPLPWLLVVARNTISNQRRSQHRALAGEREMARVAHLARPAEWRPAEWCASPALIGASA